MQDFGRNLESVDRLQLKILLSRFKSVGIMKKCFMIVVGVSMCMLMGYNLADGGQWVPYANRYAVIVMAGNVSGQLYRWYWGNTSREYNIVMEYGFEPDNVYFLSYGDSANAHSDWVDRTSTKANVQWAFEQVKSRSTSKDLVYVYWIDHGNNSGWLCHDAFMTFSTYNSYIKDINAEVFIGAYNPCMSGAVIPYISRKGLITATSTKKSEGNSVGWASWWDYAVKKGSDSDVNSDGHSSMAEAYEQVAPKSLGASRPEHPLFDDNGDGVGGLYGKSGYDATHSDSTKDGYFGNLYALDGYYKETGIEESSSTSLSVVYNYPDPFVAMTIIRYQLPERSIVSLRIYNVIGQLVRTLVDKDEISSGTHNVIWDSKDSDGNKVHAGTYFCKLVDGRHNFTEKLTVLK